MFTALSCFLYLFILGMCVLVSPMLNARQALLVVGLLCVNLWYALIYYTDTARVSKIVALFSSD